MAVFVQPILHQLLRLYLSIFSNDFLYSELISQLNKYPHNFYFILYKEEANILRYFKNKYKRNLLQELKSDDRKLIFSSEIKYNIKETIEGRIDRIFSDSEIKQRETNCPSDAIYYKLIFNDNTQEIFDGNSTVIIVNNKTAKEKVYKLSPGDEIRIYENARRGELIHYLLGLDNRIEDIIDDSNLWKKHLNLYLKHIQVEDKMDFLSKKICQYGGSVQALTVKNWINPASTTRFPELKNLIALKRVINNKGFDQDFEAILKSRRRYNSLMISTGRSLSDEIADYALYKYRGEILSGIDEHQIKSMLNENMPIRQIKSIELNEGDYE